ncbi:MAG TPA: hypothetical protein VGL11_15775 [Candidatus Binatia bacterium]
MASQPAGKSLVLLNLGQNALMVKTQYFEKPAGGGSKGLSAPDERQGQFSALATSTLVDRLLIAEGELGFSSVNSKSLGGLGEETNRLLRFGTKGSWADFNYGAEYRSVGKDFISLSPQKFAADQEGGELWTQRKFGIFGLKLSFSDFTNNVTLDPALPRITKMQGGASLSVAPSSWPVFSLFYSKGLLFSSNEPAGFRPQRGPLDSAGVSLFYQAGQWDTTLSSAYSLSNITSRWREENKSAAGHFHLLSSDVETHTPVLALNLNYRPSVMPVQVSAFGSYTKNTATDGYTDNDAVNLSTALNWTLGESRAGKSVLSLGASFNRYLDKSEPESSNRDVSVWMRLKIPAF